MLDEGIKSMKAPSSVIPSEAELTARRSRGTWELGITLFG